MLYRRRVLAVVRGCQAPKRISSQRGLAYELLSESFITHPKANGSTYFAVAKGNRALFGTGQILASGI